MNFSKKRKKKKMPNWCMNTLEIQGPIEDVDKFMEKIKSAEPDKLSLFNALIPMPAEYSGEPASMTKEEKDWSDNEKLCFEKYGHKDWYSWCNANWGVKWDISDGYISDEKLVTKYNFDNKVAEETGEKLVVMQYSTPWAPGDESLAEAFCRDEYKTLSFHIYYEEGGMGFHGALTVHNGEIVYQESDDMSTIRKCLEDSLDWI